MPLYEKGDIRIYYEEAGSGFPLLVIPGGGLNSTVAGLKTHPFNPFDEFANEFRVIAADLRNAKGGQSTGPLETGRAWDAYTDDHIGLMDHLGIRQFMAMGFCIGGPFIWNLLKRAGDRVVAAVPVQPSGYRHEMPDLSYNNNMKGWGPELCERRPDTTMAQVDAFLTNMYRGDRADFVYTVSRDFVRQCQKPVLVLPDDVPGHPYVVAMESVYLAPNAQVTLYPWKATPKQIQIELRHVRGFLRENRPAAAALPFAAAQQHRRLGQPSGAFRARQDRRLSGFPAAPAGTARAGLQKCPGQHRGGPAVVAVFLLHAVRQPRLRPQSSGGDQARNARHSEGRGSVRQPTRACRAAARRSRFHPALRLRLADAQRCSLRSMARIRSRGHDPLLHAAPLRARPHQINAAEDHRREHRLAL